MNNEKNDAYFVQKIRKDLEFITVHMRSVEIEDLNADEVLLDSMMFRMIQISENAKKLTDEYKAMHRSISWRVAHICFNTRIIRYTCLT